jgi:hypothetical protein
VRDVSYKVPPDLIDPLQLGEAYRINLLGADLPALF